MCVFCEIIKGNIPSYNVYEDNNFVAFLDISQATYGHTLLVPKKHYANLLEMPSELLKEALVIVKKISLNLKGITMCEGFNILNNCGSCAGQSVEHFHIHIIPRYNNDNFKIIPSENKYPKDELISLANKIKNLN